MIRVKDFNLVLIKIDIKLCKNIDIYYIRYITMKYHDYVKINSVNSLYLITDKVDVYIEESNGNKYLTLVSSDKNKKELIKYTEIWNGIKNLIETINGKPGEF